MSHSQRYEIDEIPVLSASGRTIGYAILDGYADLIVKMDGGCPCLGGIDRILLRDKKNDASHGKGPLIILDESDPVFRLIEHEILWRYAEGEIALEPEELGSDPDYAYDMRASA